MNIKILIDKFISQNEMLLKFLEDYGRDYNNADKVVVQFADILMSTQFNIALGLDFANVLQLTNDEAVINQYELSDIQKLFDSLLKVSESISEIYIEAAHFEWLVMDDGAKAKDIIIAGISKSEDNIMALKKLLENINNDL